MDINKVEALNCIHHPMEESHSAKCPYCGESYYMEKYITTTALCVTRNKDGININPDRNNSISLCTCINCGHDFWIGTDTVLTESNATNNIIGLSDLSLTYSKTPEEEFEEQEKISLAENYLESLGIKVKTDMYGYYRRTYDILVDLGDYLSKNNK